MSTFGSHMRALLTLVLEQLSFQKVIHRRSRNHALTWLTAGHRKPEFVMFSAENFLPYRGM